jgi:hypothetical protein
VAEIDELTVDECLDAAQQAEPCGYRGHLPGEPIAAPSLEYPTLAMRFKVLRKVCPSSAGHRFWSRLPERTYPITDRHGSVRVGMITL